MTDLSCVRWTRVSFDQMPPIGVPLLVKNDAGRVRTAMLMQHDGDWYWAEHRQENGSLVDPYCYEQGADFFAHEYTYFLEIPE